MTSCQRVRSRIQARLEDMLLPLDRAAVDAHVDRCAGCRADVAAWRALLASLEDAPEAEVPPDFAQRVMADLPEMLPAEEGAGHALRWGAAVLALVAAFVGSLVALAQLGGPEATRRALEPLSASLRLGALLVTEGIAGLVAGLSATSAAMGAGGATTGVLVVAFAAVNVILVSLLARPRHLASASGGSRRNDG